MFRWQRLLGSGKLFALHKCFHMHAMLVSRNALPYKAMVIFFKWM